MKTTVFIVVSALFCACALVAVAGDSPASDDEDTWNITSAAANSAKREHEEQIARAEERFERQTARAREVFVGKLRLAAQNEARRGNLEEANRITHAIDRIDVVSTLPTAAATAHGLARKLSDTTWQVQDSRWTLHANGTATTSAHGGRGVWRAISGQMAAVRFGNFYVMTVTDSGAVVQYYEKKEEPWPMKLLLKRP